MSNKSKPTSCIVIEDEAFAIDMMVDYIGRRDDLVLLGIGIELSDVRCLVERHNPSIVFLDLVIPSGVSQGYHIGKLPAASSIIIVSGVPLSEYSGVLPKGKLYELPKPVSFQKFNKCVDEVLGKLKSCRYGIKN